MKVTVTPVTQLRRATQRLPLALENYRANFTTSDPKVGFSQIMNDEINKVVSNFFRMGMIQGNTSTAACETPSELLESDRFGGIFPTGKGGVGIEL